MKKKFFIFILMAFVILPVLCSCQYLDSLRKMSKKQEYPKTPITVNYYVDDELKETKTYEKRKDFEYISDPTKEGLNFGGWTYKDSLQTLAPDDFLYDEAENIDLYAYFSDGYHFSDNLSYNGPYVSTGGLPSFGNPKVLVVPVNLGGDTSASMISNINTAFNGDSESTGFESVSSFYTKSSKGKLNIEFEVLNEWFTPKNSVSYYESYDFQKDKYYDTGSSLILNEILEAYDSSIDFSDYDYNNDGNIDAVWMIYNVSASYTTKSDFYWAYVTFSQNKSKKYDGCYPRYYGFASTSFMFEKDLESSYGALEIYDMSDIIIDSHTYIHETGHLLGLDDYYDNNTLLGGKGGTYSAAMMDANMGDLSTIDKLLLGWIDPYVVYSNSKELTLTINNFQSSNNVILVSNSKPTSIYSEYYLLELFDQSGLNAHDKVIFEPTAEIKFFSRNLHYENYGIRILHINAKTTDEFDGQQYDKPMKFVYNNSTTRTLFVDTILNLSNGSHLTQTDPKTKREVMNYYGLYYKTGTYNLKTYSSNIYGNYSNIFFNFTIEQISKDNATISFTF